MKRRKKTVFVENSDQQRRRGIKGWMFFAAARRPDIKSAGVLRIFFQWASICRVDRSKTRKPICRTPSSRGNKCDRRTERSGVDWTLPHIKLIEFSPPRLNRGVREAGEGGPGGVGWRWRRNRWHYASREISLPRKIMQLSAGGRGGRTADGGVGE